MRKKALDLGITTEAELESMIQAWDEWIKTDYATFAVLNGEMIISK